MWNPRVAIILGVSLLGCTSHANQADPPPGGLELLPGYRHRTLQGIDSRPGLISKQGGLQIRYEIGRVRQAGQVPLGGDFSDRTKSVAGKELLWHKEQLISGRRVHLAYTNKGMLLAAYPESGINFNVKVKSHEQLAEALLIILSYPHSK